VAAREDTVAIVEYQRQTVGAPRRLELPLGAGKYVPVEEVDRILFTGVVVLKNGRRLRARRSFKSLAQDWQRLRRLALSSELARIGATHPEALEPLSTTQASKVSGCSVSQLRVLIRRKKIQATKVSGRWVIDASSLYLWLAGQAKAGRK
jgi:hypothetical protein